MNPSRLVSSGTALPGHLSMISGQAGLGYNQVWSAWIALLGTGGPVPTHPAPRSSAHVYTGGVLAILAR